MKFKFFQKLYLLMAVAAALPSASIASSDKFGHKKSAYKKNLCSEILKTQSSHHPTNHHRSTRQSHRLRRVPQGPLWSSNLWGEKSQLRILTMNMYNIFEHQGRELSHTDGFLKEPLPRRPKNFEKIKKKAEVFIDLLPDIAVLQEIEISRGFSAEQSLNLFAKEVLGDRYFGFVSPHSNDNKTAIGFLVRKEFLKDYEFKVVSHAHHRSTTVNPQNGIGHKVFARDFPVLMMRKKGDPDPMLAVFGAHLKSKRVKLTATDRELGGTPKQWRSAEQRVMYKYRSEVNEIIKIIRNFKSMNPNTPYVISGDFNREISTTAEVMQLQKALRIKESITSVYPRISLEQRTTAFYFEGGHKRHLRQLDANFVSPHLATHIKDAWVYRYRDEEGHPLPLPNTYEEREATLPSDHYPVVVDILTRAWNRSQD